MGLSDKQAAFLISDEAEATFKSAWHRMERQGDPNKVKAGLEAVAERMREIDG